MEYKFHRKRIDSISQEKMLEELEKAAKHFNYIEFGRRRPRHWGNPAGETNKQHKIGLDFIRA